MNVMTAFAAIATPARVRTGRPDRRTRVQVPRIERRANRDEQRASAALAAQLREVREHSYLADAAPRFRVC